METKMERWSACGKFKPTFQEDRPCIYYDEQGDGKVCGFCTLPDMYRCVCDLGYKPLPISHSGVQDFLSCHYLYYLTRVVGLGTKKQFLSNPIKMGVLWDMALRMKSGGATKEDMQRIVDEYAIEDPEIQKVRALSRAYSRLGIQPAEGGELQASVDMRIVFEEGWVWGTGQPVELRVTGFYDRKYEDWFVESKLSGRPDSYNDIFFIQSQVGTYFLADDKLQSVVMEVARTPELRLSKTEEDNLEAYGRRIENDIMARPAHYFIGYDSNKRTFGKRFYRNEFDLVNLRDRYKHIFREMHEAAALDGWYKNDRACKNLLPGISCGMLPICRYGKASETVFEIRPKVGT